MPSYYLAIDIGASSGRHILSWLEDGKIRLEEIYRFENRLVSKNGHLCWDLETLFEEVVNGIARCHELGKQPVSLGIDTWGVDFVLLDDADRVLGDTVAYRDGRTKGMDAAVASVIDEPALYARTGIQKQLFNTIYQLYSLKLTQPALLEQAQRLLMIPDYFHFRLTGVKANEYTNATTGQLVNAQTNDWDTALMEKLGIPTRLFGKLQMPGTLLGELSPAMAARVGFSCRVVLPATHDTGSAVVAVPANDDDYLYISSGTWSLIGIERREPDCSERSRQHNFTNEGGYDHRFRYLKNIMGLWMLQSVKRELNNEYSFNRLCELAAQAGDFPSRVDVNDGRFLAPDSMIEAVKGYCAETAQPVPETVGQLTCCIYQSLAESYGRAVQELEEITGRTYSRIHIVGGGSKDTYLNALTARATGKPVYAGPVEATALGNLLVQMLAAGELNSLAQARDTVHTSFAVQSV